MKHTLVCLHGWGGTAESFTELRQALKGTDIEVLTPNLPGFGGEPEPKEPWSTDDYADWVESWIRTRAQKPLSPEALAKGEEARNQLHLLGHSHGGRIAIKLAARKSLPIAHLYLCAAAGIRHPRHFKRIIGLTLAKVGRVLLGLPGLKYFQPVARKLLYRLVRVHDYEQASPLMQQTLVKVSAEDLRPLLSKVMVPTDIFWGADDHMTPLADGKLMREHIPDSQLHVFHGVRHRVHRDKAAEIAAVIRARMGL